jgi:hypothetical protein
VIFPGENSLFLVGDYAINPYIPRLWHDFLDFLALKRNANQFRTNPVSPVSQERKAPIEIAATHADSMATLVKRNGRCDDEVEFSRGKQKAVRGLPYAESVLLELCFGKDFAEEHLAPAAQNGNKNALVCAPCGFDDVSRIYFVTHGQVTAKHGARVEFPRFDDTFADQVGGSCALVMTHVAAGAQRILAK